MIGPAIDRLTRLKDAGEPGVLVAFSGGKDSWACADISVRVFGRENVRAFFLYVVPGLEVEEVQLRRLADRYGIEAIRLPHPEIASYLRGSVLRDRRGSLESRFRRKLTWGDVESVAKDRTGLRWIVAGHRSCDSLHRRGMINGSDDGLMEKNRKAYPIYDWHPKHVLAYLRSRKIPVPTMFGAGTSNTSGVNPLSTTFLVNLKEHHPADFARVLRFFPKAADLIERDVLRAKYGIEHGNKPKANEG